MSTLFDIWYSIQTQLFPWLEQELDSLSEKEREFVQIISLLDLPSHKPKKRVELQAERSLEENLNDLPTNCNVGAKKNSKGYKKTWIGYKLHLDCIDGDISVSTILTSASLILRLRYPLPR